MVKSICGQFHWTPDVIDSLYLDDADHHSIGFWYERCEEISKEIEKAKNSKK